MLQTRLSRWTVAMCVGGIGLAAVLLAPNEGYTDSGGGTWFRHWEQKKDFASRTFRLLLQDHKDFNLSSDQIGTLEGLAADYARIRIRNRAAVELAEVDVKALMKNPQSELSAIEAALRKSEMATTVERLDRVKAIRTALGVLTPDQRETWKTRMRERHHDWQQRSTCRTASWQRRQAFADDDIRGAAASHEREAPSTDGAGAPMGNGRALVSTEFQ